METGSIDEIEEEQTDKAEKDDEQPGVDIPEGFKGRITSFGQL